MVDPIPDASVAPGRQDSDEHLAAVPGTDWAVWRDALLRSAGFPIDGIDWFSAPELAAVADAALAGSAPAEITRGSSGSPADTPFDQAFDQATRKLGQAAYDVASDPRFREAVSWQNLGVLGAATSVLRDGPDAPRDARRRRREEAIAKYWQRYSSKNDTVGFFGPMCWVTIGPDGPPAAGGPGPDLIRRRMVFFERWPLVTIADQLAADPQMRRWLPVALAPQLHLDGRTLRRPAEDPLTLSTAQAALVERCDGRRSAHDIAVSLMAEPQLGYRREDDVYLQIDQFVEGRILEWGIDLPNDLSAKDALTERLAAIGDPALRERAVGMFDRLCAARDALAAAEADEVAAAISTLEETFSEITGQEARRRPGETYAGRTLCHLDTVRNVEMTFGGEILAALAPLESLLQSSRWLTSVLADAYRQQILDVYRVVAEEFPGGAVPLGTLWNLGMAMLFTQRGPVEDVIGTYLERWTDVLGLTKVEPGTSRLEFTTAELYAAVAEAFPAERPGWCAARFHSPDVHVCATDQAALERGDFMIVLGELHLGWAAFDTHFFRYGHPEPERLEAAMRRDVPIGNIYPLLPYDWPRDTARNAEWLRHPDDVQVAWAPGPGAHRDRLVPVTAMTVAPDPADPENLLVQAPDGRRWPVVELFASLLGVTAFDTWKLAGTDGHTPRVTVDRFVLVRETWRTTVGATGLGTVKGERARYLAVRRWRQRLGLPERVFLRVATEVKPCYLDLTSPVYTRILCTMMRSARERGAEDAEVVLTEMLPTAEHAWLTDAQGQRYCSELRLQFRDPRLPAWVGRD